MELSEFIGQTEVTDDIKIHIASALINRKPLMHSMFYGPPGLGKTTLAEILADEMLSRIWQQTGQELKKETLIDIYREIGACDILFIDEMHAVDYKTLELLYGPMQIINNLQLDNKMPEFIQWEGINFEPFTVVGATTAAGMIEKPMRDRIILAYNFKHYEERELIHILTNKSCPRNSAKLIARRARGVPRLALNYFLRIRNEAIIVEAIKPSICEKVFRRLGVDKNGFLAMDLVILKHLATSGPTSESELYRTLGIDRHDFANMYEPFLLQKKMVKITSKGRTTTELGDDYVKGNI